MNMMTEAILAVTAIAAIIATITAAVGAVGRAAPVSSTSRTIAMTAQRGIHRQAMRDSGMSRPMRLIQPEYLPALALSQLLRLRMTHDKEIHLR